MNVKNKLLKLYIIYFLVWAFIYAGVTIAIHLKLITTWWMFLNSCTAFPIFIMGGKLIEEGEEDGRK